MRRVLIIAYGEDISHELIKEQWPNHEMIIATDGGGNYLYKLGLRPHHIIGDFDSLLPEAYLAWAEKCTFHRFPEEKAETDLELGLYLAKEIEATHVTILGAAGSRWDHTLANFGLLILAKKMGLEAVMLFPDTEVILVDEKVELKVNIGDAVSLVPLTPQVRGITTKGLKYSLADESLYIGRARGIHNEAKDNTISIFVKDGWLLIFHFREPI